MDRTPDGSEAGGGGTPPLDLRAARLEGDVGEMKSLLRAIDAKLSTLDTRLSSVAESVAEIKGRLSGFDARFAALPSTWTILTITFTTWALGSGILIAALKNLR
ncbi:MAG: hypothetical protein HXX10_18480 [Rhodoplanes sp.]|uniref:hypothetical protein n=1 Tax=Rhodoplanes sp. TaxID=1968906 RepID=UPI0017EE8361|nr:hypothetical protein [Rhodoplanes sp.]NVO16023.1 hypothetical protein [Rhodoplanes sp.]